MTYTPDKHLEDEDVIRYVAAIDRSKVDLANFETHILTCSVCSDKVERFRSERKIYEPVNPEILPARSSRRNRRDRDPELEEE